MSLVRKELLSLKPYIPGKPVEEVERELGIRDIIKLASNENPLGPSPRAVQALRDYLLKINLYPDGNCFSLKKALAKRLIKQSRTKVLPLLKQSRTKVLPLLKQSRTEVLPLQVREENLVIGSGSDELIHLIVLAFLNKGEEVITGSPSFSIYETNTNLMGGRLKKIPLNNFTFDLPRMKKAVTTKTKIIFIANPNNPTGTIVNKFEVEKFLRGLPKRIIVVFDEAYLEYVEDKDFPQSLSYLKTNKNIIILRTFSKAYGLAGLRIGYGIGDKDLITCLNRVREPFNVNSAAQRAALAALDDHEHLRRSRKVNQEGKKFLYQNLKALNLFYLPTEANFIFLDTRMDSKILFKKMLKKGIIIRSGDIFGFPTFIRVTIGTRKENERFISALRETIGNSHKINPKSKYYQIPNKSQIQILPNPKQIQILPNPKQIPNPNTTKSQTNPKSKCQRKTNT